MTLMKIPRSGINQNAMLSHRDNSTKSLMLKTIQMKLVFVQVCFQDPVGKFKIKKSFHKIHVKSLLPLPAYIRQSTYFRGLQRKDLGLVAHALPIQLMLRAYVKIVHDKFSHSSNCCGRCGRHLAFCETTNAATPLKEVSLSALPKFKWVWQVH
jgi:hypothetical protein